MLIDLPVFEIIIVVSVLLLIGLVMVILSILYSIREIKSLKSMLMEEEKNIEAFDKDIHELEDFEHSFEGNTNKSKAISDPAFKTDSIIF